MSGSSGSCWRNLPRWLLVLILLAGGLALGYGGIKLLILGGSGYYLLGSDAASGYTCTVSYDDFVVRQWLSGCFSFRPPFL